MVSIVLFSCTEKGNNKYEQKFTAVIAAILLCILSICPFSASTMQKTETPDYKVAFYAFDCYHMQDDNGKKNGYGYEMMRGISKYPQ